MNLTPAGGLVIDVAEVPDVVDGIIELAPSHVVFRPPDGGDPVRLGPPRPPGPPHQATTSDVTRRHVVWMETPSTSLGRDPWRLYRYDLRTDSGGLVAVAPLLDGRAPPPVPSDDGPSIAAHRVFWAQVGPADGKLPRVDVWSASLAGGRPVLEVRRATAPVATRRGTYVLRTHEVASSVPDGRFRILLVPRAGRPEVVVRGRTRGTGYVEFDAHGQDLVWSTGGRSDHLTLWEAGSGRVREFVSLPDQCFTDPVLTHRVLAWGDGACAPGTPFGGYLYDRERDLLSRVGNTSGLYAVEAAGDWVGWQVTRRKSPGGPGATVFVGGRLLPPP